jgi:hypothetical protein
LDDLGFLSEREKPCLSFEEYADGWLKRHAELACKPSTVKSYEQLLRIHVKPQ